MSRRSRSALGGCALGALFALRPVTAHAQAARADDLAARLAAQLDAPLRARVPETWGDPRAVGLRVTGTSPAVGADALAAALTARLADAAPLRPLTDGSPVDTARAAGLARVLVVTLDGDAQRPHATASLDLLDPGPWQTFLAATFPAPSRLARVEATLTASAAPWPSGARPRLVPTPFDDVAALALVDLDGDRRDELVVVTADRVRVARMQGASLAFVREASSSSPARAPAPLRQPLASAARVGEQLLVRGSGLAELASVQLDGGVVRVTAMRADLYPAPGFGCASLRAGTDVVAGLSAGCDGAAITPVREPLAAVPVAWLGGGVRWEFRARGDGHGMVLRDGATVGALDDVATPALLDDLDGDGVPELVTASAAAPHAPDHVRVFSLGARVEARTSLAVPGSVDALAAGDLDGDGRRELVAAVYDPARRAFTLWIVP